VCVIVPSYNVLVAVCKVWTVCVMLCFAAELLAQLTFYGGKFTYFCQKRTLVRKELVIAVAGS